MNENGIVIVCPSNSVVSSGVKIANVSIAPKQDCDMMLTKHVNRTEMKYEYMPMLAAVGVDRTISTCYIDIKNKPFRLCRVETTRNSWADDEVRELVHDGVTIDGEYEAHAMGTGSFPGNFGLAVHTSVTKTLITIPVTY